MFERHQQTIRLINEKQTEEQRLRKLQQEMGEAVAAISQYLDENRTGAQEQMISELADVYVVQLSVLLRFEGLGSPLVRRVEDRLTALRARIDAGEFDGDGPANG